MLQGALTNLLDPTVLFFILGVGAALVRSNLEIPPAVAKFLTLYLLMALGLKGGVALAQGGFPVEAALAMVIAVSMAFLVPAYSFAVLSSCRVSAFDSAAVAATYGSVSAVTFIAAQQFLTVRNVDFGGYMTVALILMESPAIIMAVMLAAVARARTTRPSAISLGRDDQGVTPISIRAVLHEAFTDGGHLLLLGSLAIGYLAAPAGIEQMLPFTAEIFKGIMAFFLLEMGLLVGRQLAEGAARIDRSLLVFALAVPPVNAAIALSLAALLGLQKGDALLLAVLSSSASYIVVPAVVRYAIPEARPGIYFTMALAVTFPFNILLGIPLYYTIGRMYWG